MRWRLGAGQGIELMSDEQKPAPLSIDVTYVPRQDRLRLTVRTQAEAWHWWLTRKMALRWIEGWVGKLESVPLPEVSVPNMPRLDLAERDLAQEHALSLEFDSPRPNPQAPKTDDDAPMLLDQLTLTVAALGCKVELVAGDQSMALNFTRKDAHCFLEALSLKARHAGWLKVPALPQWLGAVAVE